MSNQKKRYTRRISKDCVEVLCCDGTLKTKVKISDPMWDAINRLCELENTMDIESVDSTDIIKPMLELPLAIGTDIFRIVTCKCRDTYGQNNCGFAKGCPRTSSKALAIKNLGVHRHHQECAKIVPGKFRVDDIENYGKTVFTDFDDALKILKKMESRKQNASAKILKYPGCKFTVSEIEQKLLSGEIKIEGINQLDTEGHEYSAFCKYEEKEYSLLLFYMSEDSYEKQAAEQICEQMLNTK